MGDGCGVIVGHEKVRTQLEQNLPPVTLLRGPASVGKRTLALHLAAVHGVREVDIRFSPLLTVDEAREFRLFAATAPFGPLKIMIFRLESAGSRALNALLKALEEPPPTVRYLLLSTDSTLDTIASRAVVYRLGLLSESELRLVLVDCLGMVPTLASRAASVGGGQVQRALQAGEADSQRTHVLTALKAVSDKDPELLERAMEQWEIEQHELLVSWCLEAVTGRWCRFTEQESFGLERTDVPMMLLHELRLRARPKLAARVVLERLCSR